MPRTLSAFCLAAALLASSPLLAGTLPLDCRRPKTPVMRTVCAAPDLKAMDREIAALTDRGVARMAVRDQRRLSQGQVAFFQRRNGCAWASHHSAHPGTAIEECVRAAMEDRLRHLRTAVDRGGY